MNPQRVLGGSALLAALALAGCTSVNVKPATAADAFQHLCIHENPQVIVPDFVAILQRGLDRHGVSSELFSGARPAHCDYVLTYTARRSWDFATYLTHAELRIDRQGRHVASAQYHLRGKGGLSLTKWKSTEAKMTPVIDQLLANHAPGAAVRPAAPAAATLPAAAATTATAATGTETPPAAAPERPAAATGTASVRMDAYSRPEQAAQALAQMRNCNGPLRTVSVEDGRQVYSAGCWGGRKLLVDCSQDACRELQ
ncbi:Sbal_3080 family lipoprotein [Flavobacterium sp. MXW15]|uniref:Sbal_3080 family lipoprotein n=1 Tax=Xanthomonas chitinilytica TaxID=2989819 RepID=A0ABT3JUS1_9XANT|nr:Sbal_3080 family lipoprotein [Xanthomonas sp. H13-6]MCW4453402.1 Sbal_3080 family lipoprotein [Flavobacterium sp. MXW15]MCW4472245.1 Sbal_3080 family lipoprotein [Xanthomonas sp. H13-6]